MSGRIHVWGMMLEVGVVCLSSCEAYTYLFVGYSFKALTRILRYSYLTRK